MDKKKHLSDEMQGSADHVTEDGASAEFVQNPDLQKKKEQELRELKDQNLRFRKMMESLRSQGKLTPEEEVRVFGPGGMLEENEERYEQLRKAQLEEKSQDAEIPAREEIPSRISGTAQNNSQSSSQNGSPNRTPNRTTNRTPNSTRDKLKKTPKIRRFRGLGKVAAAVCIICGSIFALSMTSEANRQYVMDTVSYYQDGDTNVRVNNGNGVKGKELSEDEVRSEILETINIEMPRMSNKPEGIVISEMKIYKDAACAVVTYEYEKNKILLYMSIDDSDYVEAGVLTGKQVSEVKINYGTIPVSIYEDKDDKNEIIYSAEWLRGETSYRFMGNIKETLFEQILKEMIY